MNHSHILARMSLRDKVSLCVGGSFWQTKQMEQYGIPALFMCDGPHGLRKQEAGADMLGINQSRPATCFPTAVSTACSWDTALLRQVGEAIGREAAAMGVGLVLGPGANIKRNPLCGRNFEYFSEDPCLAGKLAGGFIQGVQSNGVGASLKHFAANSQEYKRFNSSSVMDERTLREIYLAAFELAVKEARPATVMCAYNKLNGEFCSDNKTLLTDILRTEWGFNGLVVTDWGAMNDRIKGYEAGCDLVMPGGSRYMQKEVLAAVKSGRLTEAQVDACAARVLKLVFAAAKALEGEHTSDEAAHHALAKRAATESAVLLQNKGALPLAPGCKLALIGHMASAPRYQGAGSSHINPTRLVSAVEALSGAVYAPGCTKNGETTQALLREAAEAARAADVAVVLVGLTDRYESEGFDRESMQMPGGHLRLVETVAAANPNTVVVLLCGSAVEAPWANAVNAVLYLGLPGQAGAEALADLLYGRANPCGKLAESWPLEYKDCPSAPYYSAGHKDAQYREGIYVGYRYYDTARQPVRWPFGHGLSYTRFAYSDLKIQGRRVTAAITNTGGAAGAEVAQLYLAPPVGGLHRPAKELKGFAKVFLQPGESKAVTFELDDRSFAVWANGWQVPGGEYTVLVGPSSRELPLQAPLQVAGQTLPAPAWQPGSWYEAPCGTPPKQQWEALLGHPFAETPPVKGRFTTENTVLEMKAHSWVMRLVYKGVELAVARGYGGKANYELPEFRMMMASSGDCSISSMEINGAVPPGLMEGLVEMANGHYGRGIKKMLSALKK